MVGSQSLVLATAMAVSTTVIILAFSRHKSDPPPTKQPLRSCLSSPDAKKGRPKKKVKFAENVKKPIRQNEAEQRRNSADQRSCRSDIVYDAIMQENRTVLYDGILKDRAQRMECSH